MKNFLWWVVGGEVVVVALAFAVLPPRPVEVKLTRAQAQANLCAAFAHRDAIMQDPRVERMAESEQAKLDEPHARMLRFMGQADQQAKLARQKICGENKS